MVVSGLIALILSGCGGLEQPVGDVTGRIIGATAGGYAYPVGRPDLVVPLDVQPDRVGTFHLANVPNSVSAIVIYDGASRPGVSTTEDGRAELIPIHVNGGEVNTIADRYGAGAVLPAGQEGLRMPRAGFVLAAAVPEGGATPWRPTFNLPQTVHADLVPESGGVYSVWPLPAGRFDVGALLAGFKGGATSVNVVPGFTVTAPVTLLVDGGAAAPGCGSVSASAPSQCENGLVCEPADGRCYECTASDKSHCAGNVCNAETHLCAVPQPVSTYCSACAMDGDCASGFVCRIATGATTGYCTTANCTSDADCPAGFDCNDAHVCKAPRGCDAWTQTMLTSCYDRSRCDSEYYGGLENGWCAGATSETAGYCTAACLVDSDCAVGTVTSLVCKLGPSPYGDQLQCMR